MERDLIRWFCERIPPHRRLIVGPGDDAAVLAPTEGYEIVVTTDMLMDQVDFVLGRDQPQRVGRKALAINLSDLAAMGARPTAGFISLALPQVGGESLAKALYEGLLPLAEEYDCPIAGGDTNSWDAPLVISVTLLGETAPGRAWRRSGAQPGDAILVTGHFGGSILGRHLDLVPRVREALWLTENADIHAAIDVSDGLSLDLSRICEASGCGAAIDLDRVPIAPAAHELAAQLGDGVSPLEHALGDGEDYELILAVPVAEARRLLDAQPLAVPLTMIGNFIAEPGLQALGSELHFDPLKPRGYEHRLEG